MWAAITKFRWDPSITQVSEDWRVFWEIPRTNPSIVRIRLVTSVRKHFIVCFIRWTDYPGQVLRGIRNLPFNKIINISGYDCILSSYEDLEYTDQLDCMVPSLIRKP